MTDVIDRLYRRALPQTLASKVPSNVRRFLDGYGTTNGPAEMNMALRLAFAEILALKQEIQTIKEKTRKPGDVK